MVILRQDLLTVIRKCRPDFGPYTARTQKRVGTGQEGAFLYFRENVRPNHRRTGLDRSYD